MNQASAENELDTMIARLIFGWRWWRFQPYTYGTDADGKAREVVYPPRPDQKPFRFFGPPTVPTDDAYHAGMEPVPWDGVEEMEVRSVVSVPQFSTDIAAAWLVVEHFQSNEPVSITADAGRKAWLCKIDCWRGIGETAPLAICRAAIWAQSASLAICLAAISSVQLDECVGDFAGPLEAGKVTMP